MPGRDLQCFNMCPILPPKLFTHICNWVVSHNFDRPAMRAYITHEFHHWALGPGRRRPQFLQALSLLIKPSKQRQRAASAGGDKHCRPASFCSARQMQILMRPSDKHRHRKETDICDI